MSTPWYHYHTAFELLAGANLALFAIPGFRRPAIDAEEGRWASLLAAVEPGQRWYPEILKGRSEFRRVTRGLEQETDTVRGFCLAAAVLCTAMLLLATARAEIQPEPVVPWIAIVVALLPAIILFGLDAIARCRLRQSSGVRRSLENEAVR